MARFLFLLALSLALACARAEPEASSASADPSELAYAAYVREAPEFRPVPPPSSPDRWDTWLYMPWRYRWTIGTGEASQ